MFCCFVFSDCILKWFAPGNPNLPLYQISCMWLWLWTLKGSMHQWLVFPGMCVNASRIRNISTLRWNILTGSVLKWLYKLLLSFKTVACHTMIFLWTSMGRCVHKWSWGQGQTVIQIFKKKMSTLKLFIVKASLIVMIICQQYFLISRCH